MARTDVIFMNSLLVYDVYDDDEGRLAAPPRFMREHGG